VEYTIRTALVADAEATATVQMNSWLHTYRGIIADDFLATLPAGLPNHIERRRVSLSAGSAIHLVGCEVTGAVVGWLAAGPGRDQRLTDEGFTGEVYAIYLLPGVQRRGMGRALMEAAFARLQEGGHRRVYVCALRDNAPAVAFYRRLGGRLLREQSLTIGNSAYAEVVFTFDLMQQASTVLE
jgi:ribosomal protein S18 acetylase RimI-like enzyme